MNPYVYPGLTKRSKRLYIRNEEMRTPEMMERLNFIRKSVEEVFGIDSMLVTINEPEYVHARAMYVHYLIETGTYTNRDQIGHDLGRDRTLTYYYTKKAKEFLEFDPAFKQMYCEFLNKLQ